MRLVAVLRLAGRRVPWGNPRMSFVPHCSVGRGIVGTMLGT